MFNRIVQLTLLSLIIIGCSTVLDKEPLGRLDAASFFKTEGDALQALNAAYRPLLFNNSNSNFYWVFGIVASDLAIAGGDGSRAGVEEIDVMRHTPRTQEFNDFWKIQYEGITQCNVVLENLVQLDPSSTIRDRIRGEALFLRSVFHFNLVQVFGDVPMILEVKEPDELLVPKTPKGDILQQITNDCLMAADLLPISYASTNIGRATKGAALGMAAKSRLYAQDWTQVVDLVDQINSLGVYELQSNYNAHFEPETEYNNETVWSVQHANLELGVGNFLNQWWSSKKYGSGYGFGEVEEAYLNQFEEGDPRRRFTIAVNKDDYFGLIYKPSFSSTGYSPRKFVQSDSVVTQKSDGELDIPVIRYAEVLLWDAEAKIRLDRIPEALVSLEEVRRRARAMSDQPDIYLPTVMASDATAAMQALIHERAVELGFEMHRFFDLVRWDIADQFIEGFQKGKHEVFPIPQTELDLNPMLTQNPGY